MTQETRSNANLLLIAARDPVPGQTKTRLGAVIGMEAAAHLYHGFLTDLAERFTPGTDSRAGDGGYDLGWAFSPPTCDFRAVIAALAGPPPATVQFVPQDGDTWGARQLNLLRWGHDHGYARTVLIASDSPHLSADVPRDAFAALVDHDVALGRVLDGGYYLIGVRGFHDVISDVPMSTNSAADALAARAARLGLRLAELPPTFDIDESADLVHLRATLGRSGAAAPTTWTALHELGLGEDIQRITVSAGLVECR